MNCSENDFRNILTDYQNLVVLGLSPDSTKPSHKVPLFLRNHNYGIVGVYPNEKSIAGFEIYQSLKDVPPKYRKFVNVFRKPEAVPSIVDEILDVGGVEVLWLQLGIVHPEAEKKAEAAGLKVVSNRCLHIEYEKFFS